MNIQAMIYKLLKENQYTIATAESCTGGLLASRLVEIPGISQFFSEGYITYSNEAKERLLGVSGKTLDLQGAVSKEVAMEMAEGVKKVSGSNIGVGITGIAGPGGGTTLKPVGLVYIAVSCNDRTYAESFQFHGKRDKIRQKAVDQALIMLRTAILADIKKRDLSSCES